MSRPEDASVQLDLNNLSIPAKLFFQPLRKLAKMTWKQVMAMEVRINENHTD